MTLVVVALALPIRHGCPARHPAPKKSPGPSIATTASLPVFDSTDSFTPPLRTYSTCSQRSPWVKIGSPRRYVTLFFAFPAESRNASVSNAGSVLAAAWETFLGSMARKLDSNQPADVFTSEQVSWHDGVSSQGGWLPWRPGRNKSASPRRLLTSSGSSIRQARRSAS